MDKVGPLKQINKSFIMTFVAWAVLLIVAVSVFFYYQSNKDNKVFVGQDLEINCEGTEGLPELELADYQQRFNEIYAMGEVTRNQLEDLLPDDCYVVEKEVAVVIAGSCKLLEGKYCDSYQEIQHDGKMAYAFNLPQGTPIFSPFDGAFFVSAYEGNDALRLVDLGIVNTPSFVTFIGDIQERWNDGDDIYEGQWIMTMSDKNGFVGSEGEFNLIIYAADYDIDQFFK